MSTQRASARTEGTNRESNASPRLIIYKIEGTGSDNIIKLALIKSLSHIFPPITYPEERRSSRSDRITRFRCNEIVTLCRIFLVNPFAKSCGRISRAVFRD